MSETEAERRRLEEEIAAKQRERNKEQASKHSGAQSKERQAESELLEATEKALRKHDEVNES